MRYLHRAFREGPILIQNVLLAGWALAIGIVPIAWAQPAPQTTGHKQVAVDTRILKKYVGRYLVPPARVLTVTLEDGHLFTQMTGQGKIEVLPESEHDFFVKNLDAQLTFHTDATGNATEVVLHQDGDHPFKRIEE